MNTMFNISASKNKFIMVTTQYSPLNGDDDLRCSISGTCRVTQVKPSVVLFDDMSWTTKVWGFDYDKLYISVAICDIYIS
jgi:hypothetical protein